MTDFLARLLAVIQEEAQANPDFYARLRDAIGSAGGAEERLKPPGGTPPRLTTRTARRHRRPAGALDPMQVMSLQGETALRQRLRLLDVEQLKDIIAEHGMDTTKLAMKWRSSDRLVELITNTVRDRLSKGSVFHPTRTEGPEQTAGQ